MVMRTQSHIQTAWTAATGLRGFAGGSQEGDASPGDAQVASLALRDLDMGMRELG